MDKLFDDTLYVSKDRPIAITPQQSEALFLKLAEEAIDNGYSGDDVEVIKEDLESLNLNQTGFDLAKDLEEDGSADYTFNGDFIDWLGNIEHEVEQVLKENTKLWTTAHAPQPMFKKGDAVKITDLISYNIRSNVILYVYKINMEQAYYIMARDREQKGGYILNFEKLEENCVAHIE
jgi:hypothetical protein